MEAIFCYKCKSRRASVNTRFLSCIDCFNSYIEDHVRKEIRTGPIEGLKKLNNDYQFKKPPRLELYIALGFGLSSQALLNLFSITPNTGKRPQYCIKSFINVDTSSLINKDPSKYYESVNSFIESIYNCNIDSNKCKTTPKLNIIPFCSSFASGETKADKELRQKIIDEIKLLINRGTDHIKLLIQLIVLRDIKCHLDKIDNSQQKCIVLASTSESMGSDSLQYMTLASGIHIKSIYSIFDFRWLTEKSLFFFIRPLRNLTSKEIVLYWKFNVSKTLNNLIGTEISINKSPIEEEFSKFIFSQSEKICNITRIFMKLNEGDNEQHAIYGKEKKTFCTFCGIIGIKLTDYKYCQICYSLLKMSNIIN